MAVQLVPCIKGLFQCMPLYMCTTSHFFQGTSTTRLWKTACMYVFITFFRMLVMIVIGAIFGFSTIPLFFLAVLFRRMRNRRRQEQGCQITYWLAQLQRFINFQISWVFSKFLTYTAIINHRQKAQILNFWMVLI